MTNHRRASRVLAMITLLTIVVLTGCRTPTVTAPTPTTTSAPKATTTPGATATPTTFVSPLPTPTGPVSPLPTPTSTAQGDGAGTPAAFQLAILHSNDTWGYTRPCG